MLQMGERYFFVSSSNQKGGDPFRTLIGRFWAWRGGLVVDGDAPVEGFESIEDDRKLRLKNYWSDKEKALRQTMNSANAAARQKIYTDTVFSEAGNLLSVGANYETLKIEDYYVFPKGASWNQSKPELGSLEKEVAYIWLSSEFSETWKTQKGGNTSINLPLTATTNIAQSTLAFVQNKWYADYAFEYEKPIHQEIGDKLNPGSSFVRMSFVNKGSHYSYFLKNYETVSSGFGVEELDLPNVYMVNMFQNHEEYYKGKPNKANNELDDHVASMVTLEGLIEPNLVSFRELTGIENSAKENMKIGKGRRIKELNRLPSQGEKGSAYVEYLELFSKHYKELTDVTNEDIRIKNKNIIFSNNAFGQFQQISANKHSVPFGVRLEFSAPSSGESDSLCKLIQDANFSSVFMQKAVEAHIDPDNITPQSAMLWASSTKGAWLPPEEAANKTGKGAILGMTGEQYKEVLMKAAPKTESGGQVEWAPGVQVTAAAATDIANMLTGIGGEGARLDRDWIPVDYYGQTYSLDNKGQVNFKANEFVSTIKSQAFDLVGFLNRMAGGDNPSEVIDSVIKGQNTFIHEGNDVNIFGPADKRFSPNAKLGAFILAGQFTKMLEEKARSWEDILDGKYCSSEILFFEIEKRRIVDAAGTDEIIQRFYIPNFVGKDSIEFIDSQVKFDGLYQYTISAWTAVYGNKYGYVPTQYENLPASAAVWHDTGDWNINVGHPLGLFEYTVQNIPKLWLQRLPYYTCSPIRVRDFPPTPPQVDLVPYRGIGDKIRIDFTPSLDDFSARPVALNSGDQTTMAKYYEAQYGIKTSTELRASFYETGVSSTPVRFKSDDTPRWYEVYRLNYPPTQWTDFEGARVAILDVDESQTSMIDYIVPNTDYYYTFRSVDTHKNISNPSNILRVKMVDDQGVFPLIEEYDIEKDVKSATDFKKPMRRFLQITPVFEQLVYKDERQPNQKVSVADQDSVVLGTAKDSIYGKTLKIRLTSKKTGKMFDINVKFNRQHTKPQ